MLIPCLGTLRSSLSGARRAFARELAKEPGAGEGPAGHDGRAPHLEDGGLQLASISPTLGARHFTLNHLGTPMLVTGPTGTPVSTHAYYAYYAYGEELVPQTGEAKKFTGHERDFGRLAGTTDDLDYMHARYCSPVTGRFLSVDPIVTRARSLRRPQAWNRYAYAIGNPLKYVDPSGRVFVLSGCASGSKEECNKQKSVLQQTLGDNYKFVSVGKDGKVNLNLSAQAFASQGAFESGFGALVGSSKTFELITNNTEKAAKGGGAYT